MKTTTAIIISGIIISASIIFLGGAKDRTPIQEENIQNVSIVDGKQIIEIKAKGGYIPRISTAQAGLPTVLRFNTNGTFDCSASVRIPQMNIFEVLPNSGKKDIDLGVAKEGSIQGSCGMGMYPFEIKFTK